MIMSKSNTTIVLILFLIVGFLQMNAQCNMTNSTFASGEDIRYDLYFNYGILKARAGRGSLQVTEANYRGQNTYKTVMMLNSSGLAGSFYTVHDTLTSYIDMNLRPLLFTKEAFEGKDYSVERQSFTYDGDKITIRTFRIYNGIEKFDEVVTTEKCTYDYLSALLYVRNLDFAGMKPGDRHYIQFITGRRPVNMYVNYLGESSIMANDGKRYDVINISMTVYDDAFTNQKDALRASLTRDKNRIPVVIDTQLKIGSVKAVLKSASGLMNR
jgi:hypothetical protein